MRRRGDHARDQKRGGAHDSVRGRVAGLRDAERAATKSVCVSVRLRAVRFGTRFVVDSLESLR